jgi:MarR family transcriptional regulator, lower aerobic nicotinate degradation pathway regulator
VNVRETHIAVNPKLVGPPKELLSTNTFLLKRLGFAAKDRSQEAFEGTGLNAFHFAVLALLEEDPRETQAVIADALGYDRSHIVRLLDELEERELVVRKRDPEDRRRHVVKLTADGRKALVKLRAIIAKLEDEFLVPLTPDEQAQLHGLLQRLMSYHDPRCGLTLPPPPVES